jgi:hypothetical protein
LSDESEREWAELRERLWNKKYDANSFGGDEKYRALILEQYKIYVEMADRISSRRGLANTFFLTLNTAVLTAFGVFWQKRPAGSPWWLVGPLAVLLVQCGAWYALVESYRQLNGAKYKVVGLLEEELPASPYWSAEWKAFDEGKHWKTYLPLTHIERWVPLTFAAVYLLGFVVVMLA